MASLIENLMEVLEKEEANYQDLLDLSREKTKIIIEGNIPKLYEMVDKEQRVVDKLNTFEKERLEVTKDIAIVLNKNVQNMKIKDIINMLKMQPDEQNRLRMLHDKLKKTLKMMNQVNENNKQLLKHAIELVNFDLQLYASMRKAPETANYGRDANSTGDLLMNRGKFDARQ